MPLKLRQDTSTELNLTPMIDVVFLLLIFFMAATKFAELENSIQLDVPAVGSGGAPAAGGPQRVVAIGPDGTVTLDETPVTVAQLKATLIDARNRDQGLAVVVRGDAAAPWQRIAEVWTTCREAGVGRVVGAVRTASGPGGVAR